MTCEDLRMLALEFVEGDLTADQSRAIEVHVHACRACATHIRETRALLGDLRATRDRTAMLNESQLDQGTAAPYIPPKTTGSPPTRLGDFELLEQIGSGGMGAVYRARQITLNRIVALKVMRPAPGEAATFLQRFRREAQAAAQLHHTNIVPVYAQGEAEGYVYYAMELIEGPSLAQVIRTQAENPRHDRTLTRAGGRDFKKIARMFAEVAEGLEHAHQQGIIHRDIKSHNLMMDSAERLHITDFGLARVIAEPGLTMTSEMMGTPAYMAPEQITHGGKSVDGRSDVWALGVTMYEYLTLQKPFSGDSAQQIIHRIIRDEPAPPRRIDSHIPLDLETICLRAIEKEPSRRFASAAALAADLRRFVGDFSIASRRIGLIGRAVRWCRRNPAKATAVAAVLLIALLTPVTWRLYNSAANARIDRAWDVQLNDYHDYEIAMNELGWARKYGGDRLRAQTVALWAEWSGAAPDSMAKIERLSRSAKNNADLHYLVAWTLARRASQESSQYWAGVRDAVAAGDGYRESATAAGWFFRGQALQALSPREAIESYDEAIDRRVNFTQAILLQARAANTYMYLQRDIGDYRKTVAGLEMVRRAQPGRAYPRYLLARAHTIAGEIYAHGEKPVEAQHAFDDGLAAARDAQQAEPPSPRGQIAESQCLESMGKLEDALRMYDSLDPQKLKLAKPDDWLEAFAYGMRLAFCLGRFEKAEALRSLRYGPKSGYTGRTFDPDEAIYAALIQASRGDLPAARATMTKAATRMNGTSEEALRLSAAAALFGVAIAVPEKPRGVLLPGWDDEWFARFRALSAGAVQWSEVEHAFREAPEGDVFGRRNRLESAACWYGGLRALVDGRRADALALFERGARVTDNEDYCFRSQCLSLRMGNDAAWPVWIAKSE